uniref:Uncharacterized protein n=1 Tax=Steinernema glaseri TaxID=37863 RepID=A0A1I7Z199_9BILA
MSFSLNLGTNWTQSNDGCFPYVIFLLWYTLIVLILMTIYLNFDFHYDFSTHAFHDLTEKLSLNDPLKQKFVKKRALDPQKVNAFFRSLALHLPRDLLSVVSYSFRREVKSSCTLTALYIFTYRLLPTTTITAYLLLDRFCDNELHSHDCLGLSGERCSGLSPRSAVPYVNSYMDEDLSVSYLTVTSIYLPLYFAVIWVLTNYEWSDTVIFYRILLHLSIANVMSLISTFVCGFFELTTSTVNSVIDVYVIFLLWYALIVLILMTVYLNFDFHYDFSTHYFHDPTDQYEPVVTVVRHMTTAMCLAIACKLLFLNLDNFLRSLTLHLPRDFLSLLFYIFEQEVDNSHTLSTVYIFAYRLLPITTITAFLLLDRCEDRAY